MKKFMRNCFYADYLCIFANCKYLGKGMKPSLHALTGIYISSSVLITISDGWLSLTFDNAETITLHDHEYIFVPKGRRITIASTSNHMSVKVIEVTSGVLSILYTPLLIACDVTNNIVQGSLDENAYFKACKTDLTKKFFHTLNEKYGYECQKKQLDERNAMLFVLLVNLVNKPNFITALNKAIKPTIHECIYNVVINDISKRWTLKSISLAIGVSESRIKNELRRNNTTFRKTIHDARFNMSIRMLRDGRFDIRDVAKACHIQDVVLLEDTLNRVIHIER